MTRINAQKSIFVRPPSGFIEPDDTINIPKDIKQSVLNHLHKYHGISTEVIYNDLHGFIRYQDIHQGAYAECYTGLAYQDEGNHSNAIEHYSRAIEFNPQMVAAYYNCGTCYAYQNKYDRAIVDYDKAIELEPDDAAAYYNRGHCYHDKGEYDRAIADFNKAIEINPQLAKAHYNRGMCWLHLQKWQEAEEDLKTAKSMGMDVVAAFRNKKEIDFPLPKNIRNMLML